MKHCSIRISLLVPALLLLLLPLHGEVLDVGEGGFSIQHTFSTSRSPEYVYNTIVKGVGSWWDPDHTWSGEASRLSIEPKAGGCFCERLPNGGSVEHLRVVMAMPGRRITLRGGLGPLQELAVTGALTFQLTETNAGTKVELNYRVVGYQPSGGFATWSTAVDGVLGTQMRRLQNYLRNGRP